MSVLIHANNEDQIANFKCKMGTSCEMRTSCLVLRISVVQRMRSGSESVHEE